MKHIKRFNENTNNTHQLNKNTLSDIFQDLLDENFKISSFHSVYVSPDLKETKSNPKKGYLPGYLLTISNNNINDEFGGFTGYDLDSYITHLGILKQCLDRIDGRYVIDKLDADKIEVTFLTSNNKELDEKDHDYLMIEVMEDITASLYNIVGKMNIIHDQMKKNIIIKGKEIHIDLSNVGIDRQGHLGVAPKADQKSRLLSNFKKYYEPRTFNNRVSYDLSFSINGDNLIIKYLGKQAYIRHKKYSLVDEAPIEHSWNNPNITYEDIEQYIKQ